MKISKPGIYTDLAAADYHAEPCYEAALTHSIANLLLGRSPMHARAAHPALNPDFVREDEGRFDEGTAAHMFVLEGRQRFRIIEAPDWRTKHAQAERASARLDGYVPLLEKDFLRILEMESALRAQLVLSTDGPVPLTAGTAEVTLIWREGDIWCRARLDWLHYARDTIDDYKTTPGNANPEAWTRQLFGLGYDVQAAFYLRGWRKLGGYDAAFRFIVQETAKPYAASVVSLAPDALRLAEKKVDYAIDLWRRCLRENIWPSYPTRTCYAQMPAWVEAQWLEREVREGRAPFQQSVAADDGRPIDELLFGKESA